MALSSRLPRRGLTLVELIVVLAILVALAGIVIPMLPSMRDRTEFSSGATNLAEIAKAIQSFEQLNSRYPKDWDSLTDGTTTAIPWIIRPDGANPNTDLTTDTLSAGEATALLNVGVTRLQKLDSTLTNTSNITFNPYPGDYTASGVVPATGTSVVKLTLAGEQKLNLAIQPGPSDAGKFVVLGLGRRAELVGHGITSPPVVFRGDASQGPDQIYCRYGIVFQVSSTTAPAFTRARFVGVCQFDAGGVSIADDNLKNYNDATRTGS